MEGINTTLNQGGNGGDGAAVKLAVSITYAALKALRDGGNLVPGTWYRITDYVCTTTQDNTQSAEHAFDVIVRADDASHLNENAFAAHHEGDEYFANCKLEAWELKYCLDNDTNRFAWADGSNGTGVIYWMKDEWGNQCAYDFKNIQFIRHEKDLQNMIFADDYLDNEGDNLAKSRCLTAKENVNNNNFKNALYAKFGYEDTYSASDLSSLLDYEGIQYEEDDMFAAIAEDEDYTATIIAKVLPNTQAFYTFSTEQFADASLDGKTNNIRDNQIGAHYDNNVMKLNNNVFFGTNIYTNTIEEYSFNNSCGAYFDSNSIGANFRYNSCGANFYYNSIGANFQYNSCGANFMNNSCGAGFSRNSIGAYFYSNSIGANFYSNSIGANFYGNSIGAYFQCNSCGAYFQCNSCGASFVSNSIGAYFTNNSCGAGFEGNSIGAYFQYSTIFNNVQYCNIIGGSNASPVKNTQILNGTAGEDGDLLDIEFDAGEAFMQCAGVNSSGVLKVWTPADKTNT